MKIMEGVLYERHVKGLILRDEGVVHGSSIFNKKLVFDGEKYRTPILNRGLELITRSINTLEVVKNKNERQPFDYLPLCTRSGN